MTVQLDKLLQSQGFGSRKHCQQLIKQGQVKVNGSVILEPKFNCLDPEPAFQIFDQRYQYRDKVYLALHKPSAYECSHQPQHHHSVFSLLPQHLRLRGVQCVGRLDQDTTGLLLLSDDGSFIHQLTHPQKHVKKYYQIYTSDPIDPQQLLQLQQGVSLHQEKNKFSCSDLRQLGSQHCRMAIDQGVYHQVKRMFAAVGNHVKQLHRDQIGELSLDALNLAVAEWCFLDAKQIQAVKQQH